MYLPDTSTCLVYAAAAQARFQASAAIGATAVPRVFVALSPMSAETLHDLPRNTSLKTSSRQDLGISTPNGTRVILAGPAGPKPGEPADAICTAERISIAMLTEASATAAGLGGACSLCLPPFSSHLPSMFCCAGQLPPAFAQGQTTVGPNVGQQWIAGAALSAALGTRPKPPPDGAAARAVAVARSSGAEMLRPENLPLPSQGAYAPGQAAALRACGGRQPPAGGCGAEFTGGASLHCTVDGSGRVTVSGGSGGARPRVRRQGRAWSKSESR